MSRKNSKAAQRVGAGQATQSAGDCQESTCGDSSLVERSVPRSLAVAHRGVKDIGDFAEMMSGLMSDVLLGTVAPQVANAAINAGGKLLKAAEMQIRYQKQEPKKLVLVSDD